MASNGGTDGGGAAGDSASQDAGDAASEELQSLLAQWDLERHASVFAELGLEKVRDMKWFEDDDVEALQITTFAKRKVRAMLDWWREENATEPAEKRARVDQAGEGGSGGGVMPDGAVEWRAGWAAGWTAGGAAGGAAELSGGAVVGIEPRAAPADEGMAPGRGLLAAGVPMPAAFAPSVAAPVAAAGAPVPVGGTPVAGGEHISLEVKGQDGNIVHFKMKRTTALKKLMEAYCFRQSLPMDQIRFLVDGARLMGHQTPDFWKMEDGDRIDAMVFQTNIGHWGEHEHLVGTRFLKGARASREDVRAIMRGVGAISHRALESYSDAGLDARARGALMRHADTHHRAGAGQADFKLNLSHAELATCVGEEAARRLDGLFRGYGGKDYTIVVRRVEAVAGGRCIAFHTDGSTPHTLQVRLSRESDYDGGQLVFATEEGLVATSRKAGSATLHDSSIAHGVSLHTRGVRHSLFFLDSHIDLPRAASEPAGPPE